MFMVEAGDYEIDDMLAQKYKDSAGLHPQLSAMAMKLIKLKYSMCEHCY